MRQLCLHHAVVNGLEPGKMYTFRVRAIRSNEWGPWSHYITMLVI